MSVIANDQRARQATEFKKTYPKRKVPDKILKWKPKPEHFGSGALWRFAKTVGPARYGAVTHPGGAKEVRAFADI